jgi:hypothetical protein
MADLSVPADYHNDEHYGDNDHSHYYDRDK